MLWRSCRLKKVLMIACPTFAIFPDQSFITLGGQWNPADGVDPSVDDTSLIQTVHRFVLLEICCRGYLEIMFFK
ncbi:hypothetical protein CFP56_034919 [Quercus suber]|uniref:DBC1/CARP1 catalytically inactive NUDIX hydrolase domain-containing protein n=1 Tax=Quercus suber TaxID=58331 RepID=A0AAW0JCM5_QUESU